ncbi:alpha-ketoglutarate-dependent dioxygenase AlkB [Dyella caseinilytica]|uniref:Alpha-ketoglutarate-dependent dioxygenase AlkB n=1 Tax=Dyella caseinilytica TaxID=1849581 RepID=A0ABX7GS96_9GAMM|nr:alpha-ketoglutarate-dependent dioxygenase AlkB [Dyella caseinilytica]QRN53130.1 alpha-ketoglutarate-dependent dioxygenase AlkB [Dyella caseinilytica]GGA11740.1 DNA-N1-methyladenine dioxygenase [Dyella caseinilytica]
MQALLFEPNVQRIADETTGPITYQPGVIAPDLAASWFAALLQGVDWHESSRMMYERMVGVPRLHGHYAADDPSLPKVLGAALGIAKAQFRAPFNSIGLNFYRDEHDSVAPHNDKLHELVPHQPIVLLSLGATRTMVIRRKTPPHLKTELELEAGSLLLMGWNAQLNYDHGIPKLRYPVGPRISVAFRVRPGWSEDGW